MSLSRPIAALVLLAAVLLAACGPSDPREKLMVERARWKVGLLSWVQAPDLSVTINVRVSGPVRSKLERLTVRVEMFDGANQPMGSAWQTLDLSGVQRGVPQDLFIRLPAQAAGVEGIGIDLVPDPGPEDLPHIVELKL